MPEIVISDPNPQWPGTFARLGANLRDLFGPTALRIDHIGSTAVPGLAAKDIIDIQITVADLDDRRIAPAMIAFGAVERFKGTYDHVPPGQVIGEDQRQKWLWYLRGSAVANVHIRVDGCWNQRYALLCRDFLRSHPATAAAYGEVKRQLARLFGDDAESYYDVKDPAFDLFMSVAEEWVSWTGWTPGPSDA